MVWETVCEWWLAGRAVCFEMFSCAIIRHNGGRNRPFSRHHALYSVMSSWNLCQDVMSCRDALSFCCFRSWITVQDAPIMFLEVKESAVSYIGCWHYKQGVSKKGILLSSVHADGTTAVKYTQQHHQNTANNPITELITYQRFFLVNQSKRRFN